MDNKQIVVTLFILCTILIAICTGVSTYCDYRVRYDYIGEASRTLRALLCIIWVCLGIHLI